MTSDVLKNVTIELADPQNPQIDPEIVPLLLLELILAQLNQWTQLKKNPIHTYRSYLKESKLW